MAQAVACVSVLAWLHMLEDWSVHSLTDHNFIFLVLHWQRTEGLRGGERREKSSAWQRGEWLLTKSQIMKLHIQTIRCDHMQMLHTAMIRDYDACTAAYCSTSAPLSDVSWQASTHVARWVKSAAAPPWVRLVRCLHADIMWNLRIIRAVHAPKTLFHCSFPENLQIGFVLLSRLQEDVIRAKSDVRNAFLLMKHINFLNSTHGREDGNRCMLLVFSHSHSLIFIILYFISRLCKFHLFVLPHHP